MKPDLGEARVHETQGSTTVIYDEILHVESLIAGTFKFANSVGLQRKLSSKS